VQGNAVNTLLSQGGTFELGEGRIMVTATGTDSTTTTLVVDANWSWTNIGYSAAIGKNLVGNTGANVQHSWRIAAMADQLDAQGNPNGNIVITVVGGFGSTPVSGDTFFVDVTADAKVPLFDNVQTNGNAVVARDSRTAHGGQSSAGITLGGGVDNTATVSYYMGGDGPGGRNILQQGHNYQLSFWAKASGVATAQINLLQGNNAANLFVTLTADGQWHQYTLTLDATNPVVYQNGIVRITIAGANAKVNLDDLKLIDLSDQIAPGNPLSKEVVDLVKEYGFGTIRFWHANLMPARLDDLIGDPAARPTVISPWGTYSPQLGLPEMLELAKETGTTPWIVLPTTWSTTEIHNLMEYLGGAVTTKYGAIRAADGHPGSWFADLPAIKLEAGNEQWNGTFAPYYYRSFDGYFSRAQEMFHAFKTDPLYAANGAKLKLIVGGWQGVPWFTEHALAGVPDADAVDVGAYTNGPQQEMSLNNILGGSMSQSLADNPNFYPPTIFTKDVYAYEEAPAELQGPVSIATNSAYATSLGAGLATARNSMVLTRDYGISSQNLFTMFQRGDLIGSSFVDGFYGIFADMTTASTNPRPMALAAKLLDQASGTVVSSSLSAGWMVDATSAVPLATTTQAADAMVTFNGSQLVITIFNNTIADQHNTIFHFTLPAALGGATITPDWANATFSVLSAATVGANNETTAAVGIGAGQYTESGSEVYAALAGHSMGSLVIPLKF
jgi:hypothetical protein